MATEPERRSQAYQAVLARMAEEPWTTSQLAQLAKIDPGTLGDFLAGKRWPKAPTLGKLETALGWEHGELARLRREGGEPRSVGADVQDADRVLLHLPAGSLSDLSETERREIEAGLTAAALKMARQIRAGQ